MGSRTRLCASRLAGVTSAFTLAAAVAGALVIATPASSARPPGHPFSLARAPHDLHLGPLQLGAPPSTRTDPAGAAIEQYGEVVIMEGDPSFLSDDGSGGVGIVIDQMQPQALAQRFYSMYPDSFDELIVLTTFSDDAAAAGTVAYELPVQQEVTGIGSPPGYPATFDDSAAWGSTAHKLHAFVNMEGVSSYPTYDGLAIDDPDSLFHPVLAQEFAHRWLAYPSYIDRSGASSTRLIGRAQAHWSVLMQADASVMDGNRWVERDDGSFDCTARMTHYSALDLYLMGLGAAREVPPFFVINDAITDSGQAIDVLADWYYCQHLRGSREDIAVSQIISAMGPRVPAFGAAPTAFRVAFVLVTRVGESAEDALPVAQVVERARQIWQGKFSQYSNGRGSVCTQVSAPCGAATAKVIGGTIVEAGGNGNGVIEPGEPIAARFALENDGPVDAQSVTVTLDSDAAAFAPATLTIDRIASGATTTALFSGSFTGGASACDTVLTVHATATVGAGTFRGFASVTVGAVDRYREHFDSDGGGWAANLDGGDTALIDSWEWGHPLEYDQDGYVFQPDGGADGSPAAWFTGPARGDIATGATHSLSMGTATLWSPPIDLSGSSRPQLEYAAWFEAIDRTIPDRLQVASTDLLVLEARSTDGPDGNWYKLDQIDGADDRWRPRMIDIESPANGMAGLDLSGPVVFRFTVNRGGTADLVEAGVDEFAIVADAPGCLANGGDGGAAALIRPFALVGCGVGGGIAAGDATGGARSAAALGFALAAWAWARRRRVRSR